MPNDLFELEYAPEKLDVISIEAEYRNAIYNLEKLIKESADKIDSESNEKKKARLEKKQEEIKEFKKEIENESKNVKKFITKYYDSGQLKKEYKERTDEELVSYFKSGVLNKYSSGAVVLHENTYHTVLDYMRDIEWD